MSSAGMASPGLQYAGKNKLPICILMPSAKRNLSIFQPINQEIYIAMKRRVLSGNIYRKQLIMLFAISPKFPAVTRKMTTDPLFYIVGL